MRNNEVCLFGNKLYKWEKYCVHVFLVHFVDHRNSLFLWCVHITVSGCSEYYIVSKDFSSV